MDDLAVFGANVRRLRNARGWTQKELAARCGINTATIGTIEQGLNSTVLRTAIQLARIFETSLDAMIAGDGAAVTPVDRRAVS